MVAPADAVVRRAQPATDSARAILLTILGEFVYPTDASVWTSGFVRAMGELDIGEKATRQALARTSAHGLVDSARHGRRVLWRLTDHGREVLEEGTERIYSFLRHRQLWDGRWLVLNAPIPESRRKLRQRLSTRLTWLGLGSPTPGLWITPHASRADSVAAVLRDLGLTERIYAWVGPTAEIGQDHALLPGAWDLEQIRSAYDGFVEDFTSREVTTAYDAFAAQVRLVQAWRRFPLLDPDLPAELLPTDWPGPAAATLFHERHARWRRRAQRAWDIITAAG